MLDGALLQQLPALDPNTMAASQVVGPHLSASEWLGPLAPIALSPFFGLATLSGIATYGPLWLQQRSALFQANGALDSPLLFWSMAGLALFTSLPRLTKVSKPISLAAEKLEAYSAIIILVVVRMFGSQFQSDGAVAPTGNAQTGSMMLSAGFAAVSLNVMMSAFAALNVFVINMMKLFFEFLVWLIPIPAIDAVVEITNKSVCVGLMSLYTYSPWLATMLNLIILAISLIAFLWVYRRVNYYKELIAGPALAWLAPSWFAQRGSSFNAFVESSPKKLPKYLPVTITAQNGKRQVSGRLGFKRFSMQMQSHRSEQSQNGWICQRLTLRDDAGAEYQFCTRKWVKGDSLFQEDSSVGDGNGLKSST
jgi:hypothetical protein